MAALLALDSDDHEFGYDFTPEDEANLLQLSELPPPASSAVIDAVPGKTESVASTDDVDDAQSFARLRARNQDYKPAKSGSTLQAAQPRSLPAAVAIPEDVPYPDLSRALSSVDRESSQDTRGPVPAEKTEPDAFENDGRSPLQKFRTYPKKPFSVSDLTSGAWCELQYAYTLTLLPGGRRTRTAAMKGGTKIHQKLEEEVHTTVKIDVLTKEDGFGLRLWNLVQGLRTLRDVGMTRELEVWGMVDGNVVNGIIDNVSYESPNPQFEQELSSQESQAQLDPRQSKLFQFFSSDKKGGKPAPRQKAYLSDVKTRGSTAPITPSLVRPAKIQLMLYHRFLSDMAAGRLDFFKVMRRYGLEVDDPFSDSFVAQIGGLHDEIFVDAPDSSTESSSQEIGGTNEFSDPSSVGAREEPDLVKYNSLRELVSLVQDEVELTFPAKELSIGPMLRVQYVHRTDGRELDNHDFPVHDAALQEYLDKYMEWWHGERPAKGVEIEEAFKCRTCEHAAICSWRKEIDEELVKKAKQKGIARRAKKS